MIIIKPIPVIYLIFPVVGQVDNIGVT